MTVNDKLNVFRMLTLRTAEEKSDSVVQEYKDALDSEFKQYETDRKQHFEDELIIELDQIRKMQNDDYSNQVYTVRRDFSLKLDRLNDRIFEELVKRIIVYKKKDEYKAYLVKKIEAIREYVKWGEEQYIFIDMSDANLKGELEGLTHSTLLVSTEPFIGGVTAIVNGNVLIDFSFKGKIDELKENFSILKYAQNIKRQ